MLNKKNLLCFVQTLLLTAGLSSAHSVIGAPQAFAQIGDELGLSPFWDWKTIETEHFRITFPKELADSAQKTAQYLEEAHSFLSPKLRWSPRNRTQILLVDNADAANGLTSAIGRFGIVLYMTPPDNWFSTEYYDDWLRLLVIHEYTHMLNMDATHGLWQPLRILFGDVLLPNAVWPSWMLEGLAVYMETRFTKSGRGRSPYYEMLLRSAVEQNVLDDPKFITLDKVNGTNPYFPYGETAYLFGYQLMNQVALQKIGEKSADGATLLHPDSSEHPGENMLGDMSYRSSFRIPYFINGNLENISGRDWYENWAQWVEQTRVRARSELAKIRTQPVTQVTRITHGGQQTLGSAFSPDGQWIAFTRETSDQLNHLYLLERANGNLQELDQKLLGGKISFTPDSKNILYSTLNRKGVYYLWSDLKVHSLVDGQEYSITDGLRARDPNVSQDGRFVTFTITRDATTGLAIAPLLRDGSKLKLGTVQTLMMPTRYDAIHTPQFSADGKRIYFSWHRNGQNAEEIAEYNLSTRKTRSLVANGHMNRFPAIRSSDVSSGELYFVSDLTGVDNIYRYREGLEPEMATNTTSGFAFPTFDAQGKLFANIFSASGWDIAEVKTANSLSATQARIAPPPAPTGETYEAPSNSAEKPYPVEDYSIIPSIWPRQWLPVFIGDNNGVLVGGQVLGFDATDRHRYVLGAAYNTFVKKADVLAVYSNRMLGPDLSLAYNTYTTSTTSSGGVLTSYERKFSLNASAAFPIRWTYSSLTPIAAFNMSRTYLHVPGANGGSDDVVAKSRYVPSTDTLLVFTNAESSKLGISPEEGRFAEAGDRVYFNSGDTSVKALLRDTEYIRTDFLMKHSVMVPSLAYSWVNHLATNGYTDADVLVEGRQTARLINSLPGPSLDALSLRGYPLQTFYTKQATVGSLDYRFPLWPIFRGWGTNPLFLENLSGFVFGEAAYFPSGRLVKTLPSAGAGVRLETLLLNTLPLTLSTEYDKGFREDFGARGEVFFQFGINAPLSL